MKQIEQSHHDSCEHHEEVSSKTIFGFWIFLITDFMLFATIFAVYAVLENSTFGGISSKNLTHLPCSLSQALILLLSSLTVGLGGASAYRNHKKLTLALYSITFLLGLVFMWMEVGEMSRLMQAGNGWQKSAFLSAYFTLVGTHGVHMVLALIWTLVFLIPLIRSDLTPHSITRLTCLRMFWQFLNIVWVFIFSFVYLRGAT